MRCFNRGPRSRVNREPRSSENAQRFPALFDPSGYKRSERPLVRDFENVTVYRLRKEFLRNSKT